MKQIYTVNPNRNHKAPQNMKRLTSAVAKHSAATKHALLFEDTNALASIKL